VKGNFLLVLAVPKTLEASPDPFGFEIGLIDPAHVFG
jgi:hypothetical protein